MSSGPYRAKGGRNIPVRSSVQQDRPGIPKNDREVCRKWQLILLPARQQNLREFWMKKGTGCFRLALFLCVWCLRMGQLTGQLFLHILCWIVLNVVKELHDCLDFLGSEAGGRIALLLNDQTPDIVLVEQCATGCPPGINGCNNSRKTVTCRALGVNEFHLF